MIPAVRRRRALVATALLLALAGATVPPAIGAGDPVAAVRRATGPALASVHVRDAADVAALASFDRTEARHGDHIQVVLWPGDEARLRELGLDYEIDVADLGELAAAQAAADAESDASVAEGGPRTTYRRLADYEAELADLAARFPGHVQLVRGAHLTHEGREVLGVEITRDVAHRDGRPTSFVMGVHHAREWPSGELTMELATLLAEGYGTDERITSMLDAVRVLLVPVVNPDGFVHSRESVLNVRGDEQTRGPEAGIDWAVGNATSLAAGGGGPYWRKNRRGATGPTAAGHPTSYGVDPNRNYGFMWGDGTLGLLPLSFGAKPGASIYPTSGEYQGDAPFSEPETRNVRDWVLSRNVATLLTNHTYTGLVLWPWGHTDSPAPDAARLESLGRAMARVNGYRPMQSIGLYPTTGTTDDWSYATTGALSYTFEIGHEFHPHYPNVIRDWDRNRDAMLLLIESAGDPTLTGELRGTIRSLADGSPLPATLRITREATTPLHPAAPTPYDTIDERVDMSIETTDSGAFSWRLPPSTRPVALVDRELYTLTISAPGHQPQTATFAIERGELRSLGTVYLRPA